MNVEFLIASQSWPYEPVIEDISDDEETAPVPEWSHITKRQQNNGQVHVTGQQCSVTSAGIFKLVISYSNGEVDTAYHHEISTSDHTKPISVDLINFFKNIQNEILENLMFQHQSRANCQEI